jgi:hypothetical protein
MLDSHHKTLALTLAITLQIASGLSNVHAAYASTTHTHATRLNTRTACAAHDADDELPTPDPDLPPLRIVMHCMDQLKAADITSMQRACECNWAFSNHMLRGVFGGSLETFCKWARENPTFTCMVGCFGYTIEQDTVVEIAATPTRGAMFKVVVTVQPSRLIRGMGLRPPRRYLWTLQCERRPPLLDCWLLQEVLAVDRAIELTT